jgi:hypothetical protein
MAAAIIAADRTFSAMVAAKLLTLSQSLNAPAIVFHRVSIDFFEVRFC